VAERVSIDAYLIFQNDKKGVDIERLIIYDQYFALLTKVITGDIFLDSVYVGIADLVLINLIYVLNVLNKAIIS
jgi:hypothetical protein